MGIKKWDRYSKAEKEILIQYMAILREDKFDINNEEHFFLLDYINENNLEPENVPNREIDDYLKKTYPMDYF